MRRNYLYLIVEGYDGCGKTTAIQQMKPVVEEHGAVFLYSNERGAPLGEYPPYPYRRWFYWFQRLKVLSQNDRALSVLVGQQNRFAVLFAERSFLTGYAYEGFGDEWELGDWLYSSLNCPPSHIVVLGKKEDYQKKDDPAYEKYLLIIQAGKIALSRQEIPVLHFETADEFEKWLREELESLTAGEENGKVEE